jgi:hypothetical protein
VCGESLRDILEDGRGDQDLLESLHGVRQSSSTGDIEFREDVVEDQNRIPRVRFPAKHGSRGELEREGERPGFAMARITTGWQAVQCEDKVITVWPDQSDPTIQFRPPNPIERATKMLRGLHRC